jgi:hypothetical protein
MVKSLNPPLPKDLARRVRQTKWAKHTYKIRAWWYGGRKYLPQIIRRFAEAKERDNEGEEVDDEKLQEPHPSPLKHWRFVPQGRMKSKDLNIYFHNRLIIDNEAARKRVFDSIQDNYGGVTRTARFLQRTYLGITYQDVRRRFAKDETRQLKMDRIAVGDGKRKTFIATNVPGARVHVDFTFHGPKSKWPVFGAVDVFSRFGFYVIMDQKTAAQSLAGFKIFLREFKQHTDAKVSRITVDSGSEFKGSMKKYCEDHHIFVDAQKRPARLIESLNKTLRLHAERVGYARKSEFERIIVSFNHVYNNSIHKNLAGQTPLDVLALDEAARKTEAKRQVKAGIARVSSQGVTSKIIKKGAMVRIYIPKEGSKAKIQAAPRGKASMGHRGLQPHWSKGLYVVVKRVGSKRGDHRYKIRPIDRRRPVLPGLFFPDRLQVVQTPEFNKWKPRPGDIRAVQAEIQVLEEHQEMGGDKIKDPDWRPPADHQEASEAPHGPRPPRPKRVIKAKAPEKMKGRKIQVYWDGEIYKSLGYILERYNDEWIVYFRGDGSVTAFADNEIHRMTNEYVSEATVEKKKLTMAAHIAKVKKEIDNAKAPKP